MRSLKVKTSSPWLPLEGYNRSMMATPLNGTSHRLGVVETSCFRQVSLNLKGLSIDPERSLKIMVRLRQHQFTTTHFILIWRSRSTVIRGSLQSSRQKISRDTLTSYNLPVCHCSVVIKRVRNLQMQFRFTLESKRNKWQGDSSLEKSQASTQFLCLVVILALVVQSLDSTSQWIPNCICFGLVGNYHLNNDSSPGLLYPEL